MKYQGLLLFLFWYLELSYGQVITTKHFLTGESKTTAEKILNLTGDIIRGSQMRVAEVEYIKQNGMKSSAFEIGYLMAEIIEKYRKMIAIYQTTNDMLSKRMLYKTETIAFLEELEHFYWDIQHLLNMMHEIEKKYDIKGTLDEDYEEPLDSIIAVQHLFNKGNDEEMQELGDILKKRKPKPMKKKRLEVWQYIAEKLKPTSKKPKPTWWPLDYGWEINTTW